MSRFMSANKAMVLFLFLGSDQFGCQVSDKAKSLLNRLSRARGLVSMVLGGGGFGTSCSSTIIPFIFWGAFGFWGYREVQYNDNAIRPHHMPHFCTWGCTFGVMYCAYIHRLHGYTGRFRI